MTPFMAAVEAALAGDSPSSSSVASPRSAPVGVAATTSHQVAVRALAEQIVCEANAVLARHGRAIALTDEVGDGGLAFTLTIEGRAVRLDAAGAACLEEQDVPALVLALITGHELATARPG